MSGHIYGCYGCRFCLFLRFFYLSLELFRQFSFFILLLENKSYQKMWICLNCPIMCLYVLSSVLWCPLRFPHKTDVRFVLAGVFMPYLCFFCLFVSSYCVPYVASFSGLSMFDCPFGIILRLFNQYCPIVTSTKWTLQYVHCIVCPSSIYGFWLPLWYLQTCLWNNLKFDLTLYRQLA